MFFLMVSIEINCLCLRNWRKWAYGCRRRINTKWFACYDFEAYQWDFREGIDQVEEIESEEGTPWNKVHVPVSSSVGCNLEGVETVHVSSKDP